MKLFPLWLLITAGIGLLAVLLAPFYLFGNIEFFDTTNIVLQFCIYLLANMLWLTPILLFFASLECHRRGYPVIAACISLISILITIAATLIVIDNL